MEGTTQQEREVRAARNQALFRSVNERLSELNEAFEAVTRTFTIACECADTNCIEMVDIRPAQYHDVRANPRHFAVRSGHVYPEVEVVVGESDGYVVVEKIASGAEVAELLARTTPDARG